MTFRFYRMSGELDTNAKVISYLIGEFILKDKLDAYMYHTMWTRWNGLG
jgi:hypothetical protein